MTGQGTEYDDLEAALGGPIDTADEARTLPGASGRSRQRRRGLLLRRMPVTSRPQAEYEAQADHVEAGE